MKFDQRILAAAAAALLAISGISGCGSAGSAAGTEASDGAAETSADARETEEASGGESTSDNETNLNGSDSETESTADDAESPDGADTETSAKSESARPAYTYHLKAVPVYDSAVSDKDSMLLATSAYYLLSLQDGKDPVIQKALDEVNADSEKESGTFAEDNKKDAQEWRDSMIAADNEENDTFTGHYSDQNTLSVERADSRCLSILRSHSQFLGGAHGMTVTEGYSFDAQTGKKLTLSDVLKSTDELASILYKEVKKQSGPEQAAGIDEDAASTIEKMVSDTLNTEQNGADSKGNDTGKERTEGSTADPAGKSAATDESTSGGDDADYTDHLTWYVGGDGIHFVFDAYDIGPYAAGAYSVVLTPKDYPDLINTYYTDSPENY